MHGMNRMLRVSFIGLIISDIVLGKYTDLWAVHIEGGEEVAKNISAKYGFIYHGQILPDYYQFQHRKVAKRSAYPSSYYHRHLAHHPQVKWIEQQVVKKRVKRDTVFNDPKWPIMWYLNRGGGLDMNVQKAWNMGYTGRGVVVTILDDGIEKDHPDLRKNYDERASFDVNGHDNDPQPRYDATNENRHGTRCAGEVAAQADNFVCSVGVAHDARIGGVRMLDGDVTDSVEAQSLSHNTQHIHIYSASWGPDDDGRTVDGPATLARKAFYDGITKGRGGLGSIFVWASGNGGRDGDNCNCDGYTNSIYTLSISSSTEHGNVPWYSESCSSTLATTYSSGSIGEKQIVTTDLRKDCTESHTGTSASAPLAAGIIALALQANPSMTWRDMQHVVVETAKPDNLNAPDWAINGAGKKVSHSFGFGLMDAAAMVEMARNWTTVPMQHICEIRSLDQNRDVPMNGRLIVTLVTDGCERTANHVRYLEHVQARITMTSARRGEIQISLISPSGTRSVLLAKRTRDTSREGFNNWAFMTTHNWGESAEGKWKLEIENGASYLRRVRLRDWVLVLYGTDRHPRKSPTNVRSARRDYYSWNQAPVTSRPHHYFPSSRYFKTTSYPSSTTSTTTTTTRDYKYYHPWNWGSLGNDHHRTSSPPHLKDWTLVVMGTKDHPMKQNVTTKSSAASHAFTCAGATSNGICIECKPGFFKMDENCVAECPDHFYGSVQAVHMNSPVEPNAKMPSLHTQGICKPCHESCLKCQGAAPTDCYQCAPGYERQGETGVACHKTLIWDLLDPAVMKHLAWAIILCIGAIILFSLLFAILQARQRRRLCWAVKPNYVPDWTKGAYNGVSTLDVPGVHHPTAPPTTNSIPDRVRVSVHRERDFSHASLFQPPHSSLFVREHRMNGFCPGAGYAAYDPAV